MPEARDSRRRRLSTVDVALSYRRPSTLGVSELSTLPIGPVPAPELAPITGSELLVVFQDPTVRRRPSVENTTPATARRVRVRAATSRGVLPSWYPRTPLHDISVVVRAIERRRARIGNEEEEVVTETLIRVPVNDRSISDPSSASSSSRIGIKIRTPYGSKVPKIFIDFSKLKDEEGDSEILTPQKKLLNSIDEVEKVIKQEVQKLKRTPTAKRAEREKRVKTLMSMS